MRSLIIHRHANGWVAYILFAGVAPGAPDVIGTPEKYGCGHSERRPHSGM